MNKHLSTKRILRLLLTKRQLPQIKFKVKAYEGPDGELWTEPVLLNRERLHNLLNYSSHLNIELILDINL